MLVDIRPRSVAIPWLLRHLEGTKTPPLLTERAVPFVAQAADR